MDMDNNENALIHPDSGLEEDTSSGEDEGYQEVMEEASSAEVDEVQVASAMDQSVPDQRVWPNVLTRQKASLHSYLGAELEVVRGRTVLEEGAVVTLDMLQPVDLVLMPGQTLPLTVFDHPTMNMLRNSLKNERTFGVLATWSDGRNTIVNNIGTTAEIYEYKQEEGTAGFRVKARARQRFRLLDAESGKWKAKVRILPEVKLPDPLVEVKLQSLNRLRRSRTHCLRCKRMDAAVTRWPMFVYDQYNLDRLVKEIKQELTSSLINGQKEKNKDTFDDMVPNEPTELSFWVARNLPMKEEHRLLLLKLNSPIQRLRWELQALQKCRQVLCCQYCMNSVAYSADIFSMSIEGPQSTYVNPGGFLHETITLYQVKNIFSVGSPSTEFSWFPGYAWTICKCKHCNEHMGWKFTATNSKLKPAKFWGICRRSITVKLLTSKTVDDDGDDNNLLVF